MWIAVISFFTNIKENFQSILAIIVVILLCACLFFYKQGSDRKEYIKSLQEKARASERYLVDKSHEDQRIIQKSFIDDLAAKDSLLKKFLDDNKLKNKQIETLKKVKIQKTTEKIVTVYDTLYEFIELNNLPKKTTIKHDNCLTTHIEFTDKGLKEKVDRTLEIYDFNYWKRNKILCLKIGRKEFYQTLVTSCGDTITQNQKLTFN